MEGVGCAGYPQGRTSQASKHRKQHRLLTTGELTYQLANPGYGMT